MSEDGKGRERTPPDAAEKHPRVEAHNPPINSATGNPNACGKQDLAQRVELANPVSVEGA